MQTITIGIIGLGRIGASAALALKRYNATKDARQRFEISGYDPTPEIANALHKRGALDHAVRAITAVAADKDIVLLALPASETLSAYALIGRDLREGCVLLDTAALKQPSLNAAKKHLAGGAHMIGITPILNSAYLYDGLDDSDHAAVDLFDKGMMLLMPSVSADRDAVALASDLVELLGAQAHFVDPLEHDVWIAAMEAFPAALTTAAFHALRRRAVWTDAQRAGNPTFGRLTHHLKDTHPDDLRDLLLNSREPLVVQLDALVESLTMLRTVLASNDRDALESLLIDNRDAYIDWFIHREAVDWDKPRDAEAPRAGMILSGLFGSALANRLRRNDAKGE